MKKIVFCFLFMMSLFSFSKDIQEIFSVFSKKAPASISFSKPNKKGESDFFIYSSPHKTYMFKKAHVYFYPDKQQVQFSNNKSYISILGYDELCRNVIFPNEENLICDYNNEDTLYSEAILYTIDMESGCILDNRGGFVRDLAVGAKWDKDRESIIYQGNGYPIDIDPKPYSYSWDTEENALSYGLFNLQICRNDKYHQKNVGLFYFEKKYYNFQGKIGKYDVVDFNLKKTDNHNLEGDYSYLGKKATIQLLGTISENNSIILIEKVDNKITGNIELKIEGDRMIGKWYDKNHTKKLKVELERM